MPHPPPLPPDADRLNTLFALLNPGLVELASDLNSTPLELANWLASPQIAPHLAALSLASEALDRLRTLGSRAPALAACQTLLSTDNPIELRRVATALLRTPPARRPTPLAAPQPAQHLPSITRHTPPQTPKPHEPDHSAPTTTPVAHAPQPSQHLETRSTPDRAPRPAPGRLPVLAQDPPEPSTFNFDRRVPNARAANLRAAAAAPLPRPP